MNKGTVKNFKDVLNFGDDIDKIKIIIYKKKKMFKKIESHTFCYTKGNNPSRIIYEDLKTDPKEPKD